MLHADQLAARITQLVKLNGNKRNSRRLLFACGKRSIMILKGWKQFFSTKNSKRSQIKMKKNKKLWIKITAGVLLALQLFIIIPVKQIPQWGVSVCGEIEDYYDYDRD